MTGIFPDEDSWENGMVPNTAGKVYNPYENNLS